MALLGAKKYSRERKPMLIIRAEADKNTWETCSNYLENLKRCIIMTQPFYCWINTLEKLNTLHLFTPDMYKTVHIVAFCIVLKNYMQSKYLPEKLRTNTKKWTKQATKKIWNKKIYIHPHKAAASRLSRIA